MNINRNSLNDYEFSLELNKLGIKVKFSNTGTLASNI